MEDTLRDKPVRGYVSQDGLNPCFNGRYSQRLSEIQRTTICSSPCLNPCFNGRYSQSRIVCFNSSKKDVLILVLMEDTLRVNSEPTRLSLCQCLNPCFNGRYSQSYVSCWFCSSCCVLILVLMEDTLREHYVKN